MQISRRQLIATGAGACLWCATSAAAARVLPTDLQPLVGDNYKPVDADEKGLWQAFDRFEEELAESDLVLRLPDLQTYTAGVVERLLGRPASEFRVYILRDPSFNASLAPTGMMLVHTGLLARVHDEAQLACVLGHESGHYFRKHSIANWPDLRTKWSMMGFIGSGADATAGYAAMQGQNGQSWIGLANSINASIVLSLYRFSREQEVEADAYGIGLAAKAGYTPESAPLVWQQLIEERTASAKEQGKHFKDQSLSALSTHPPTGERLQDLTETAADLARRGSLAEASNGREQWRRAIAPHLAGLLEEQVMLNDPGASVYVIEGHAQDGWTGVLRYYEGEAYRLRGGPEDDGRARQAYAAAIELPDAPPEAWRANGYALIKSGNVDEGRLALLRYLELRPDAKDAAMVKFSALQ